jgi:hypothetical protein
MAADADVTAHIKPYFPLLRADSIAALHPTLFL